MPDNSIDDNLFIPVFCRIYASEKFPGILHDEKALTLKDSIPESVKVKDNQTQYSLLVNAVRSANMDLYVQDFIKENPDGVIIQLGCGLETSFYRNNNGKNKWYEIDSPDVIKSRKSLLEESENDSFISADIFDEEWIKTIRKENPDVPLLINAGGLFYSFSDEKVFGLLKSLKKYGSIDIVFDAVNSAGMNQISKDINSDPSKYFYVDSAQYVADEAEGKLIKEEAFYAHTPRKGLKFMTSMTMKMSDRLMMLKTLHIKIN